MEYTTKQLQERYKSLPEDLKDAIWSAESAATVQSIGKKYGLNVEQTGKLASETGLVLLGLVHPKDYIKNLSGRASVDMDTARKIAEEVNGEIFSKVKENLKKLHGIGVDVASGTAPEKEQKQQGVSAPPVSPSVSSPPPSPKTTLELFQKHEPEKRSQTAEQKQKPAESPAPMPPPIKLPIPIAPHSDKKELEPKPKEPVKIPLIFAEKIKEEPHREQSQVIEIENLPALPSEQAGVRQAPNIPNAPKNYEKGNDPYKEPLK